jgi:apolipoprotein N-acyltransferase
MPKIELKSAVPSSPGSQLSFSGGAATSVAPASSAAPAKGGQLNWKLKAALILLFLAFAYGTAMTFVNKRQKKQLVQLNVPPSSPKQEEQANKN